MVGGSDKMATRMKGEIGWSILWLLSACVVFNFVVSRLSTCLASVTWWPKRKVIIPVMNFTLSFVASTFVTLSMELKKTRGDGEVVGLRNRLRILAYSIVTVVKLVVVILAIKSINLNVAYLSCIPSMVELITTIIEVKRDPQMTWRGEMSFLLLMIFFTLGQGITSALLSLASKKRFLYTIINYVLGLLILSVVFFHYEWKYKRDGKISMKDHLRIIGYFLIFVTQSGLLAYAAIAMHFASQNYAADLSFLPLALELYDIYHEPTPFPTLGLVSAPGDTIACAVVCALFTTFVEIMVTKIYKTIVL